MPKVILCKSSPVVDPSLMAAARPDSPLTPRSLKDVNSPVARKKLDGAVDQENSTPNSPVQRSRKTKSARRSKAAKQSKKAAKAAPAESIFEPRREDVAQVAGEDRDKETINKPLTKFEKIAELVARVEELKEQNRALKAAPQVKRIKGLLEEVERLKEVRSRLIANKAMAAKIQESNLAMQAKADVEAKPDESKVEEDEAENTSDAASETGSDDTGSEADEDELTPEEKEVELQNLRAGEIYKIINAMELEEHTFTSDSIHCLVEHALRGCTWCWETHVRTEKEEQEAVAAAEAAKVVEANAATAAENQKITFAAFCKSLKSGIKVFKQPTAKTRSLQRRTISTDGTTLFCGSSLFAQKNHKKIQISEIESVTRMSDKDAFDKYGKCTKKYSNRFTIVHKGASDEAPTAVLELQPGDGWRGTSGECHRLVFMLNKLVTEVKEKASAARFEAEELKAAAAAAKKAEEENAIGAGVVQCAEEVTEDLAEPFNLEFVKSGMETQIEIARDLATCPADKDADAKLGVLAELKQKIDEKSAMAGALEKLAGAAGSPKPGDSAVTEAGDATQPECSMEEAELVEVKEYADQLAADVAAAEVAEAPPADEVASPEPPCALEAAASAVSAETSNSDATVDTPEVIKADDAVKLFLDSASSESSESSGESSGTDSGRSTPEDGCEDGATMSKAMKKRLKKKAYLAKKKAKAAAEAAAAAAGAGAEDKEIVV